MADADKLLKLIKKIVLETISTTEPTSVLYGEVLEVSPLKIKVDNRYIIDSDFIVVPSHIIGIIVGDKLTLLKTNSGQEFIVIGKV